MELIGLRNLCTPALFYLMISMTGLILTSFGFFGTRSIFCIGKILCNEDNVYIIFLSKIFFILLCTWILNIICRKISSWISWIFVILPILLMIF